MGATNYNAIAARLESDCYKLSETDLRVIMRLLGHELTSHGRLRFACRPMGESHWQSLPGLADAKDAELWLRKPPGRFIKIVQDNDQWTAEYVWGGWRGQGVSRRLGSAMFAAFVRSEGPRSKKDDF